jgi:quinoprotein glucose dehydrogenase
VTENDLIDYTPELKAEALKIAQQYTFGPLFTPPSHEKPLLAMPSVGGGANWPGCAFDPETQMLYIPSMNWPSQLFVAPPDPARSNLNYARVGGPVAEGPRGLPLLKGPYGELVAMDLQTGTIAWRRANGGTQYNEHPALKGLDVSELGSNGRAAAIVTKALLIATDGAGERSGPLKGGGGLRLRMFDKSTGGEVAAFAFTSPPTGVPMTYMRNGRQFIVVALGTNPAQLVALALPKEHS